MRSQLQASVFVPALVLLIGATLRIMTLGLDVRFHPDEALFAAQARLITTQGDLLLRTTDLDKPPLTFYATALSFGVLGNSELAARLPNVLFSVTSIALLFVLAHALYSQRSTAALSALLLALSPLDLAFAPTVFTDVQATTWVLLASWLAVRDRWRAAGITAAMIFAAKPNAVLFVPLLIVLGIARNCTSCWHWRDYARRVWKFAWPFLLGIALVLLWDVARAPRSFLGLGWQRNDPGRFIRSDELWPRLDQWSHWLSFFSGSSIINVMVLFGLPCWLVWHQVHSRTRAALIDGLVAVFGLAFIAWHWLIAFNTYDRYLHTLVPFALLLTARMLVHYWKLTIFQTVRRILPVLLLALLLAGILPTLRGEARLGGDQGQHSGIDTLAAFLNAHLANQTVYDHWLGWELAYYLGPHPTLDLDYMPRPEALADDMRLQTEPRYFVAPSAQHAALWLDISPQQTISTHPIYQDPSHGFVVYELAPPPLHR